MDAKEVLDRIRAALNQVQSSGQSFVFVPSLLQFLTDLERNAPEASELRRLQHESNLEWYRSQHQTNLEMLHSVLDAGKGALTSSILVNGGATVALLAFAGSIFGRSASGIIPAAVVAGIVLFAFGVLSAAIASGTTYVTQYCYHSNWRRSGIGFHVASVLLVAGSYVLFAAGVVASYHAFL